MDEDLEFAGPSDAEKAAWTDVTFTYVLNLELALSRLHASRTAYQDTIDGMTNTIDGLEFLNAGRMAEIEDLKSDVADLDCARSDEATENARLVKERDELRADAQAYADTAKLQREWKEEAEAQRDAALEALIEADEALRDYACATDDIPCIRSASQCSDSCGEPAVFARQTIARVVGSRTLGGVGE